jgi:hypothetical protein
MIFVKSYLKDGDSFYSTKEFEGKILDPDYVEGAIEITVNEVELITRKMWDYVDQIWAYIIQGLITISEGENFSTYFPDQPIELSFTPIFDENLKITVKCDESATAIVNKKDFIKSIIQAVKPFLVDLAIIVPVNAEVYKDMVADLESLESKLRGEEQLK